MHGETVKLYLINVQILLALSVTKQVLRGRKG